MCRVVVDVALAVDWSYLLSSLALGEAAVEEEEGVDEEVVEHVHRALQRLKLSS